MKLNTHIKGLISVKTVYFGCLILISHVLCAQNERFSQFYFAPTILNAGNTGLIDGQYRLSSMYRNQWASFTVPYNTANIAFDGNFYVKQMSMDQVGYGAFIMYDRSGDGALSVLRFMPSVAFHKALDKSGKYNVSLGTEAGFIQKSIDFSNLVFPDQYNGNIFDKGVPTHQTYVDNSIFHFDAGVGLLWYYTEKGKLFYKIQLEPPVGKLLNAQVGFSVNQVNRSRESFLGDRSNRLIRRYSIHGKAVYSVRGFLSVHGMFMYLKQNEIWELTTGADAEYIFESMEGDVSVSFGARYRAGDALVFVLGHRKNEWRAGLSFDTNISSLSKVSRGFGSIELATSYIFKYSKKIPCPKWNDY
jgi:type IX secretion system PorP/SprF family membrane protein